jgi:hypothetical protein
MTGPDLRRALHDLSEDARVPDLLDRALATSRRIRRRRLAAAATGTAVTLVLAASAVAMVRPSNGAVVPPATDSTTTSTCTPPLIPTSPAPPFDSGAPLPTPPFDTGATLPAPPSVSDQLPPTAPTPPGTAGIWPSNESAVPPATDSTMTPGCTPILPTPPLATGTILPTPPCG